ncbi:MAG: hypothetical protein AB7O84_22970 [Planctomycetota bacterium]
MRELGKADLDSNLNDPPVAVMSESSLTPQGITGDLAWTALVLFVIWCVADYCHVTFLGGSYQVRPPWFVFVGIAVVVFLVHFALSKQHRVGSAIVVSVVSLLVASLAIGTAGLYFHLWIGGGS